MKITKRQLRRIIRESMQPDDFVAATKAALQADDLEAFAKLMVDEDDLDEATSRFRNPNWINKGL